VSGLPPPRFSGFMRGIKKGGGFGFEPATSLVRARVFPFSCVSVFLSVCVCLSVSLSVCRLFVVGGWRGDIAMIFFFKTMHDEAGAQAAEFEKRYGLCVQQLHKVPVWGALS
jgi:hypothetical protein